MVVGDFPFHNDILYRADVHDLKIETSANLTLDLHFEFMNVFKTDLTFDFEPILIELGMDLYNTVWLGDNCFWFYYTAKTLSYNTHLAHDMADCGYNLKDGSISDAMSIFGSHPFYKDLHC